MGYKDDTWFARYLMTFARNLNICLGFPMCQPRSSSQCFKRTHQGPRALMLTFLGLAFFQRWHSFLLAMGELGKPLTILPFTACPLPWPRSLGSFVRFWTRGHHLSLLLFFASWFWLDIQWIFHSFPSFRETCEWLVPRLSPRSVTHVLLRIF